MSRTMLGSLLSFLVVVLLAASLHARQPEDVRPPDRPWAWSLEARIESRFNPQENAERWEEFLAANASASAADRTTILIDGSRNPELYLPTELLSQLLAVAFVDDPAIRDFWRDGYTRRFGEDLPTGFWTQLEALSHDYLAATRAARTLARTARGADAAEAERLLVQANVAQSSNCRLILDTYQRARQVFGEDFDRFLYLAVASGLNMTSESTPAEVEFAAGGCK